MRKPLVLADFPEDLRAFVRICGFEELNLPEISEATTVLGNLGQTGDDFDDVIDVLPREFGVDMSDYDWRKHTPTELHRDSLILSFRNFFEFFRPGIVQRTLAKYEPVTLGRIGEAIRTKKWR